MERKMNPCRDTTYIYWTRLSVSGGYGQIPLDNTTDLFFFLFWFFYFPFLSGVGNGAGGLLWSKTPFTRNQEETTAFVPGKPDESAVTRKSPDWLGAFILGQACRVGQRQAAAAEWADSRPETPWPPKSPI